jgi:hypothetical protein
MAKIKSDITADKLLDSGWIKTNDAVTPFTKAIVNRNPLNTSEDSDIKMVVHCMYNEWTFAVCLPDGGMLNLNVQNFSQLKQIENAINFYDPPF